MDASDVGMGSILEQEQDGEMRVLGYASVSFSPAQKKYCATERELAAIRFGVNHFKPYLYGRNFTIKTDHQALIYLEQMKSLDRRLMRTYEELQIGTYKIQHIKGENNVGADTLSRAPLNNQLNPDSDDEQPEVTLQKPIMIPAGGPNTLFESLKFACEGVEGTCADLRISVVEFLLNNFTKYGYVNKSSDKKLVNSLKSTDVFVGH